MNSLPVELHGDFTFENNVYFQGDPATVPANSVNHSEGVDPGFTYSVSDPGAPVVPSEFSFILASGAARGQGDPTSVTIEYDFNSKSYAIDEAKTDAGAVIAKDR